MNKPLLISHLVTAVTLFSTAIQSTPPHAAANPAQAGATGRVVAAPDQRQGPRKREFLNNEVRGLYVTSWIAGMKRFREIADGASRYDLNARRLAFELALIGLLMVFDYLFLCRRRRTRQG